VYFGSEHSHCTEMPGKVINFILLNKISLKVVSGICRWSVLLLLEKLSIIFGYRSNKMYYNFSILCIAVNMLL